MWWAVLYVLVSNFYEVIAVFHQSDYEKIPGFFEYEEVPVHPSLNLKPGVTYIRVEKGKKAPHTIHSTTQGLLNVLVHPNFDLKPGASYIRMGRKNYAPYMLIYTTTQAPMNVLEQTSYKTAWVDDDLKTSTTTSDLYYDSTELEDTGLNIEITKAETSLDENKVENVDNATYVEENEKVSVDIDYKEEFTNNIGGKSKEDSQTVTGSATTETTDSTMSLETISNVYIPVSTHLDSAMITFSTVIDTDDSNYVTDSTRKTIDYRTSEEAYFTTTTTNEETDSQITTDLGTTIMNGHENDEIQNTLKVISWQESAVDVKDREATITNSYYNPTHSKSANALVITMTKPHHIPIPSKTPKNVFINKFNPTLSKPTLDLITTVTKTYYLTTHYEIVKDFTKPHRNPTRSKFTKVVVPTRTKQSYDTTLSKSLKDLKPTITIPHHHHPTPSKSLKDTIPHYNPTQSKPAKNLKPTITSAKHHHPIRSEFPNDEVLKHTKTHHNPTQSKPAKDLKPTITSPHHHPAHSKSLKDEKLKHTIPHHHPAHSKSSKDQVLKHTIPHHNPTQSKPAKYLKPTITSPKHHPSRSKSLENEVLFNHQPTRSNSKVLFNTKPNRNPTRSKSTKSYHKPTQFTLKKVFESNIIDLHHHPTLDLVPTTTKLHHYPKHSKSMKVLALTTTKAHPSPTWSHHISKLQTLSRAKEDEIITTESYNANNMPKKRTFHFDLKGFSMRPDYLVIPTTNPHPSRYEVTTFNATIYTEDITATIEIGTEEVNTESTIIIPAPVNEAMVDKFALIERTGNNKNASNKEKKFDVDSLLNMLSNLIDNDKARINIADSFNKSLQKYNIPTCVPVPSTPFLTTTEQASTIDFSNSTIVAKCYVCGLDVEGIPYSSACADAFAGDFIALAPVQAKSKGMISKFRKYCHYLNVNRVISSPLEPNSVFGRFTGGCSVRWVDLTGVYTQRSCRNRRRAVLGKHFASKRMAKLEMALSDVSDGCIISPMATLLPVSRAISLYARFHACVCTGYWCNRAVRTRQWMTHNVLILAFASVVK